MNFASSRIGRQVVAFSIVGSVGFLVDVGGLWLLLELVGIDPYRGRGISCTFALLTTWLLNRTLTFGRSIRELIRPGAVRTELGAYIFFQYLGFSVNIAIYSVLVASTSLFQSFPLLAVAFGSVVAMFVNFVGARRLFVEKSEPGGRGADESGGSPSANEGRHDWTKRSLEPRRRT